MAADIDGIGLHAPRGQRQRQRMHRAPAGSRRAVHDNGNAAGSPGLRRIMPIGQCRTVAGLEPR